MSCAVSCRREQARAHGQANRGRSARRLAMLHLHACRRPRHAAQALTNASPPFAPPAPPRSRLRPGHVQALLPGHRSVPLLPRARRRLPRRDARGDAPAVGAGPCCRPHRRGVRLRAAAPCVPPRPPTAGAACNLTGRMAHRPSAPRVERSGVLALALGRALGVSWPRPRSRPGAAGGGPAAAAPSLPSPRAVPNTLRPPPHCCCSGGVMPVCNPTQRAQRGASPRSFRAPALGSPTRGAPTQARASFPPTTPHDGVQHTSRRTPPAPCHPLASPCGPGKRAIPLSSLPPASSVLLPRCPPGPPAVRAPLAGGAGGAAARPASHPTVRPQVCSLPRVLPATHAVWPGPCLYSYRAHAPTGRPCLRNSSATAALRGPGPGFGGGAAPRGAGAAGGRGRAVLPPAAARPSRRTRRPNPTGAAPVERGAPPHTGVCPGDAGGSQKKSSL
jgi:hypothetical protein